MPLSFAALLIVVVHLATGLGAWFDVGLLADDREFIGGAILRHRGTWSLAESFLPEPMPDAARALYRPFVDLLFWWEQPYFGTRPFGYHVVNSTMHCGTALLWFGLLRRWTGCYLTALAGSVLFVGWPGHSEATHWIAARTNLSSVFVMSGALFVHDLGLTRARTPWRWSLLSIAALLGAVAVGCKESAVFVLPMAGVIAWLRSATFRAAVVRTLPMTVAVCGWLAWRARMLGTFGTGDYGWKLERVSEQSCADWATVLLAPFHSGLQHPLMTVGGVTLALVHGALLLLALSALRRPAAWRVARIGGTLVAMGYVAGVGLEPLFVSTLQGVRYTYEAAIGLAAVYAIGIARLPTRVALATLAVVVAVHALALGHNRQSWVQASAVYERMRGEIEARARTTGKPVRVFDAPGVYDGAFALLNGYTEFLFWQQTAPPGTNLRGSVTSTQHWGRTMEQLARAAANGEDLDASLVRWSDGALVPLRLDPQWPAEPFAGVTVDYARIAREGIVAGTLVPVQVRLTTSVPVQVRVGGETVALTPAAAPQPLQLWLPAPRGRDDFSAELVVVSGAVERRYPLGTRDVLTR